MYNSSLVGPAQPALATCSLVYYLLGAKKDNRGFSMTALLTRLLTVLSCFVVGKPLSKHIS